MKRQPLRKNVVERDALRARVEELTACSFPDSKDIAVVTLPNGERWACAGVVGAEIERLRARVAELEQWQKEIADRAAWN